MLYTHDEPEIDAVRSKNTCELSEKLDQVWSYTLQIRWFLFQLCYP